MPAETLTAKLVLYDEQLTDPLHIETVFVEGSEFEIQLKKSRT